jgi:hypothetical protein
MYLLSFATVDKNMKAKIGNLSCFSQAEARFHEPRRRLRRSTARHRGSRQDFATASNATTITFTRKSGSGKSQK